MAVCYTNDMDDLVLLYERVDDGSLHTYLYQRVGSAASVLFSTCWLTYLLGSSHALLQLSYYYLRR